MNRILIVYPPQSYIRYLKGRDDIDFFGDNLRAYSGSEDFSLTDTDVSHAHLGKLYTKAVEALSHYNEALTRWCYDLPRYEDFKRILAITIIRVKFALVNRGYKSVLFHTAIPHHIDTISLAVACQLAGIRQVYLTPNKISQNFIPISTFSSIRDATLLEIGWINPNRTIRQAQFLSDLHIFRRKILDGGMSHGKRPRHVINRLTSQFYFGLMFSIYSRYRTILAQSIRKIRGFRNAELCDLTSSQDWSLGEEVLSLLRQRSYLRYLRKNTVNLDSDLHYSDIVICGGRQPEAFSQPGGGRWGNYLDLVMHIRGLGYSGKMYFKEHPHQYSYVEMKVVGNLRCGNTRDRFYYSALKSMGCQFLGPTVSLTDKRCIVIAVSGTVALERAVLGLPTVVAGHVWYQDIGLISKLDDIHSLDQLMQVSSHSLPHPLINERLIALALEREAEINETENLTEDGGSESYLELLNCLLNEPELSLE